MAKGQYTFRDFLRERGEESLIEQDRAAARNVLREVKMGLSAMAVLSVLVVVLFHESDNAAGRTDRREPATEDVELTIRSNSPRPAAGNETPGSAGETQISRIAPPPAPATQERRSGSEESHSGPAEPAPEVAYKVASGDTLGVISQKLYGSSRYWEKLAGYNGISDPRKLRAGQVLKVPPLEKLKRSEQPDTQESSVLPPPVQIDARDSNSVGIPCI